MSGNLVCVNRLMNGCSVDDVLVVNLLVEFW